MNLSSYSYTTVPPAICVNFIHNNRDDINPFVPSAPFLYPLKTSENHKV